MNAALLVALIVVSILLIVAWVDYRRAKKRLDKATREFYERMGAPNDR